MSCDTRGSRAVGRIDEPDRFCFAARNKICGKAVEKKKCLAGRKGILAVNLVADLRAHLLRDSIQLLRIKDPVACLIVIDDIRFRCGHEANPRKGTDVADQSLKKCE